MRSQPFRLLIAVAATLSLFINSVAACTGITLRAQDGTVVFGRTLEWGSFDLHSRLVIVPRGHEFRSETPDGALAAAGLGPMAPLGWMRWRRTFMWMA